MAGVVGSVLAAPRRSTALVIPTFLGPMRAALGSRAGGTLVRFVTGGARWSRVSLVVAVRGAAHLAAHVLRQLVRRTLMQTIAVESDELAPCELQVAPIPGRAATGLSSGLAPPWKPLLYCVKQRAPPDELGSRASRRRPRIRPKFRQRRPLQRIVGMVTPAGPCSGSWFRHKCGAGVASRRPGLSREPHPLASFGGENGICGGRACPPSQMASQERVAAASERRRIWPTPRKNLPAFTAAKVSIPLQGRVFLAPSSVGGAFESIIARMRRGHPSPPPARSLYNCARPAVEVPNNSSAA